MICKNCGYDKWDGTSTHMFGGRPTSGVNCWGPKTHVATARRAPVEPAKSATGEQRQEREQQKIDHQATTPKKEKKPTRAEKIAAKFASFGLKVASALPAPDPSSRPTKRLHRDTDPVRRSRRNIPSAESSGRTESTPENQTEPSAATHGADRTPDSDTRRTRAPIRDHPQRATSEDPFGGKTDYRKRRRQSQR